MAVRVLLVDDMPDVRQVVRMSLRIRDGIDVVGEAASGAEAIALAEREQPDIVVLDLGLPDLAGQEVLSGLREVSPRSKVVVFSATDPEDSAGIAGRVEGYAIKENDLSYLLELIETLSRSDERHTSLRLPASPASAREARSFTRTAVDQWELAGVADDALLVVTELVTNAVTHADSDCELRLSVTAQALRIEVTDTGAGTPDPLPPSATRNHGRGLHMIDAVASAWGVEPADHNGKTVWAELRLPLRVARGA